MKLYLLCPPFNCHYVPVHYSRLAAHLLRLYDCYTYWRYGRIFLTQSKMWLSAGHIHHNYGLQNVRLVIEPLILLQF